MKTLRDFWRFFIASGVWYPMLATSLLILPLAAICCANGKWWGGGLIIAEPWIIFLAPIYADYRIYRKQTVPQVRIALTEEEVKLGLQADWKTGMSGCQESIRNG